MSEILNKIKDVDPNNSDAIKDVLATFFQKLLKLTEVENLKWLRTLETVITRFPKYCMSHRNTVETFLIHFLDSNNYHNVIAAAKCAHALQQVRPSQKKTATAKSCWREQMSELCNAAHSLLSAIFPHAADLYKNNVNGQDDSQTATSPLSSALSQITTVTTKTQSNKQNVPNKHSLLCSRLKNVLVFLQAMLVESYPVAKPVRPQTILDVIVRALSVSSGTHPTGNMEPSDIGMVKTQALRSLDALIVCLGPNLIPFSPLVFRFVMQTLKWSSDHPSEESREVRVAAYGSLVRWLSSLRTHRAADRGRCWEDELTTHIIDDVTPPKHVVQLTMNNQSTKHLSKKARKKLANSTLHDSALASHMPGEKNKISIPEEINDVVAIAALECAETFLTVCGLFLKPATHKRFQERLVRECFGLRGQGRGRGAALLRALEAGRRAAPPAAPPPTQYCLQLYSQVAGDDSEISKFCSQALLDIRLHLHCSPPSLSFAMEVPPANTNKMENRKKVSERNRRALENLLGPLPNDEEIITIADEPSRKKARIEEDITDKISVSSESGHSIEISDESEEADSVIPEAIVVIEKDIEENSDGQFDAIDGNDVTDLETNDKYESFFEETINDDQTQAKHDNCQITQSTVDDSKAQEVVTIYEAITQMPVNTSDTIDEESPLSMEVAYDYPNTESEKVTVLEGMEDENLPSTNDTDDIQITCGQVVKYSQEVEPDKNCKSQGNHNDDVPKVNGVDKSPEKTIDIDVSNDVIDKESSVTAKISTNNGEVTVDDMLADFVDEVNEDDTQVTQT